MLYWGAMFLPPLIASITYFRASPRTESLAQRFIVSAHGLSIFALCLGGVLIGSYGHPQQEYGAPFRSLCWAPVMLIAYSFLFFRGSKAVHWLHTINLVCLLFVLFYGGMAVTGVWL
jgi:hypothetical protein